MPKGLERVLRARAKTLGLTGDRLNAYVYGTLREIEKKRKKKG